MIDDVWASLQAENRQVSDEVKKRKKTVSRSAVSLEKPASKQSADVITLLSSMGLAPPPSKKKLEKKSSSSQVDPTSTTSDIGSTTELVDPAVRPPATASEILSKIAREVNILGEEDNAKARRKALQSISKKVFDDYLVDPSALSEVFRDISKPLFKRFADSNEGCREDVHKLVQRFFSGCRDLIPVLGYFFPALMRRANEAMLDLELQIFVNDKAAHAAYKRGRAVERQDKAAMVGGGGNSEAAIEPSEEVRLQAVRSLHVLVDSVVTLGAGPILHPYFEDILLFIQVHAMDTSPEVRIAVCAAVSLLCSIRDYEVGMKHFAVALVRALLPTLRHKLSRVKIAALSAINALFRVRDMDKRRSAASAALADLVGFREENVLPILAFYSPDVTINYLAEIVVDGSAAVKDRALDLLSTLLITIEDRMEHETRLLPYLLDLLTEDVEAISSKAYMLLSQCGQLYDDEHRDEVLVYKQYAVAGPDHLNILESALPAPFNIMGRPALGVRLYVRGNSVRFLSALLREVTHWQAGPRVKALRLLQVLFVLCEDGLTGEAHHILPALANGYLSAVTERQSEMIPQYLALFELVGRYLPPDVYTHFLLPRLTGDRTQYSAAPPDALAKTCTLHFLALALSSARPAAVFPLVPRLLDALCDEVALPLESPGLQAATLECLVLLLPTLVAPPLSHAAATAPATADDADAVRRLLDLAADGEHSLYRSAVAKHLRVRLRGMATVSIATSSAHQQLLAAAFSATGRMHGDLHTSMSALLRLLLVAQVQGLSAPGSGGAGGAAARALAQCVLAVVPHLCAPAQRSLPAFLRFYSDHLLEKYLRHTTVNGEPLVLVVPVQQGVGASGGYDVGDGWAAALPDSVALVRLVGLSRALNSVDGSTRLLEYLLALCEQMQARGQQSAGQAALLHHLGLLEELLLPVLLPAQANRVDAAMGSLLSPISEGSDQEAAAVVAAIAQGGARLAALLGGRWGARSTLLQAQRLRLVALVSAATSVLDDHYSTLHPRPVAWDLCAAPRMAVEGQAWAALWLAQLLEVLLEACGSTNPPALRLFATDLACHLLAAGVGNEVGAVGKLRPFARRSSTAALLRAKAQVLPCLGAVLALLYDGDDEVRRRGLDMVGAVTPLLLSAAEFNALVRHGVTPANGLDGKASGPLTGLTDERLQAAVAALQAETEADAQRRLSTPEPDTGASPGSSTGSFAGPLVFDRVVAQLLAHYVAEVSSVSASVSGSGIAYAESVDVALRRLCVLDAQAFEAAVRAQWAALQPRDEVAARLSALISHADLLLSLSV